MAEANISVVDSRALLTLFGTREQHLRQIRDALGVKISARDDQVHVEGSGEAVAQATQVLEQLKAIAERNGAGDPQEVTRAIETATGKQIPDAPVIDLMSAARKVQPRTQGQARYVKAIAEHDLVFCIGPAGTGK